MIVQPPGQLPDLDKPEVVMMICTSGHVDHGKTLLVKMLTGCSTDRLKEEQERGMTIELGFAPCFLGGNLCVGIVDVPGHEKFVKTMVAGVSGIGLTVLVIAADDGIMPQTVEHVQIMELLGVRQGIVALTKIDLVDEARVQQCISEIRTFLKSGFLADAPICPLSSKTFEGYGAFYEVLVGRIQTLIRRPKPGVFRMPIERVFSLPGQGTVISGIPVDGMVEVGQTLEVVPGGETAKVRGIQRFLRDASQGGSGQCLALNMPDLNKHLPTRGQVLCAPGYVQPARCFHVRLKAVPGLKRPLHNNEEIKFHTGTSEEAGRLFLLESPELAEGQDGFGTVLLNQAVPGVVLDRFILRRPSPPATVAGGEILAVTAGETRPRKAQILPRLQSHLAFFAGVDPWNEVGQDKRVEWFLLAARKDGGTVLDISRGTFLMLDAVKASLARLVQNQKIRSLAEDYFIHIEAYAEYYGLINGRLEQAEQQGKGIDLTLADLRQDCRWPIPLWNRVQADLEQAHQIRRQGDKLVLSKAAEKLPPAERDLLNRILATYESGGYHSPRPEELPGLLNASPVQINRLLNYLYTERQLVRLSSLVVLSCSHYQKAQALVVKLIQEKGLLNSADFKYHLDTSRKYALAILDFMDARRITLRVENDRKLTAEYQKHLL